LGELVRHVNLAVERFQAGELNAFEVDELIFQYSRAAKELWKFCSWGTLGLPLESSAMNRPATGGIAVRVDVGDVAHGSGTGPICGPVRSRRVSRAHRPAC
jgi:hypothetical protein